MTKKVANFFHLCSRQKLKFQIGLKFLINIYINLQIIIQAYLLKVMPIILNDQEESYKYDLLKQSLRDEVGYRLNKNHSFSTQKDVSNRRKQIFKSYEDEFSDWNSNSTNTFNTKNKIKGFILPVMNNKRKSQNIQDLSRELLKYEQFSNLQKDQPHKFRLSILKQMTKINFKRQEPKVGGSPKKVNIQLQFPDRYKLFQQNNDSLKNYKFQNHQSINQSIEPKDSFYVKRPSKGLIPSMKKLLSSSFPKKPMFRSESDRDSYQQTKLLLNRCEIQNAKKSIIDDNQIKFQQKDRQQRQKKVKLARIQRKLPINFLSYSHRRHMNRQKSLQAKLKNQKFQKSPYLQHPPLNSYYPRIDRINESISYENKRLSECILLKSKKNTQMQDGYKQ